MTKSILLATKNISKFELVKSLMCFCGFENYDFFCLKDLDIQIEDKKEEGSIFDRARQKALDANKVLKNKYDFIAGIDDGIEIKGKIETEVKKILPYIIEDELLTENEIVNICRGFYFISKNNKEYGFITKIPFKYKKFTGNIDDLKNSSYPLSYVLCTLNSETPVINLDKNSENTYYKKYCEEFFKSFDKIDN